VQDTGIMLALSRCV